MDPAGWSGRVRLAHSDALPRGDTMSAVTELPDERLLTAWGGVLGAPGTQTSHKMPSAESLLQEDAAYRVAVGRAIAEMHLALADCPYDIDRGVIGPDQFAQRWDRLRVELPEDTFDVLRRRVDPRWEQIVAALACAD